MNELSYLKHWTMSAMSDKHVYGAFHPSLHLPKLLTDINTRLPAEPGYALVTNTASGLLQLLQEATWNILWAMLI